MKDEMEREFQLDAIEVALHQINRRLAKMEQEENQTKKELYSSPVEKIVEDAMIRLEKEGKHRHSFLLGMGYAVLSGIFSATLDDDVSPLVSSEARKWI